MKDSIIQNKIKKILVIIFWIIIWEIIALLINKEVFLPSPFLTLKTLYNMLFVKEFYISVGSSLLRLLTAYFLSCFLGIAIGYVCGISNFFYQLINPLIIVMRATPVISIIILAIIMFHSNIVPVIVSFLMCFPIMWTNVVEGIRNTDEKLLQMCKIYNIKKWRIIKSVYLYSALPYITSGMISALGIGWKVTAAAEVLSFPDYSIGTHLYDSKIYLETKELFAWTIVVIILSYISERILKKILSKSQNY